MQLLPRLAIAAILAMFAAVPASATTVYRYAFSATVRDIATPQGVPSDASLALLATHGIVVGATMSGEFAFDTSVPDTDPDRERGQYFFAVTDGYVDVGSFHGSYKRDVTDSIIIANNSGPPFYDAFSGLLAYRDNASDMSGTFGLLQLRDSTQVALTSDANPAADLPPLEAWDAYQPLDANGTVFYFSASLATGEAVAIYGEIDLLRHPVPLPAGAWLLASALGALRLRWRAGA